MRTFDRPNETMNRDTLDQVQLERVQALLARLSRNNRRYRDLLGEIAVTSLADLRKLPTTGPEDLVKGFPYGMFALPLREVIRLHSAVGPEGGPLVIGHTRNDLSHWGRLVARQLVAAGVTAHDVIQICFESGAFEKALGYMLGAELIEASVIPQGPFHIEYELSMMQNYRTTVLITTPSNAWDLVDLLNQQRIDPQSLHLRVVLLSRPVRQNERDELRRGLFADVCCSFGIDEILNPGLAVECPEGSFHVNEDQFLVEEIDGELVVTTLLREAMPLLRYRTQTACEIRSDHCPCGRTGVVLSPGERLDGRLRVCETSLYRAQIADVLSQTPAADRPFLLDVHDRRVVVSIEVTSDLFDDRIRTLQDMKHQVESEFLARLGVEAQVRYLGPLGFQERRDAEEE